MQANESADVESTDLSERDIRALTECMSVLPIVPGMFEVDTESGSEYTVDSRTQSCTCPDFEYRNVKCKHIRRCEFATGARPIPDGVDVDEQLGIHVEGGPDRTDSDTGVAWGEGASA